jgi:hypothetical protein
MFPMTNDKLIDAYREAVTSYEAAKTGTGSRVETFTTLLMAERVLTARLGWVNQNLEQFWERYTP